MCITKDMVTFTYGKHYQLMTEWDLGNLIDLENDFGDRPLPSFTDGKKPYFVTVQKWREMQLKSIGEE